MGMGEGQRVGVEDVAWLEEKGMYIDGHKLAPPIKLSNPIPLTEIHQRLIALDVTAESLREAGLGLFHLRRLMKYVFPPSPFCVK